jgi:hypothetical protein
MYQNEIMKEVWANRKKFSEQHHNNIDEMVKALSASQKTSSQNRVDRRTSPKLGK